MFKFGTTKLSPALTLCLIAGTPPTSNNQQSIPVSAQRNNGILTISADSGEYIGMLINVNDGLSTVHAVYFDEPVSVNVTNGTAYCLSVFALEDNGNISSKPRGNIYCNTTCTGNKGMSITMYIDSVQSMYNWIGSIIKFCQFTPVQTTKQ